MDVDFFYGNSIVHRCCTLNNSREQTRFNILFKFMIVIVIARCICY